MLALIIALSIIAFILLVLFFSVHITVNFDDTLKIKARYLFVTFRLFPAKEKVKKPEKKPKKATVKKEPEEKEKKEKVSLLKSIIDEDGIVGLFEYLSEMFRLASKALKRVLSAIIIKNLFVNLVVSSEDAYETAMNYGRACAVIYPAVGVFASVMKVKNSDIDVSVNFLNDENVVKAELKLRFRPIRIVWAGLCAFFGYLWYNIKSMRKNADDENYAER